MIRVVNEIGFDQYKSISSIKSKTFSALNFRQNQVSETKTNNAKNAVIGIDIEH